MEYARPVDIGARLSVDVRYAARAAYSQSAPPELTDAPAANTQLVWKAASISEPTTVTDAVAIKCQRRSCTRSNHSPTVIIEIAPAMFRIIVKSPIANGLLMPD